MYNVYNPYSYPNWVNIPMRNLYNMYNIFKMYPCPYYPITPMYNSKFSRQFTDQYATFADEIQDDVLIELKDYGPEPYVVNIDEATKQNDNFRTALWTGDNLQVTLMSIPVGEDIGLEIHPTVDQFIRIEEGNGLVKIGDSKYNLNFREKIYDDYAIMIPAGKWHNIINTGDTPLKLYSIYAPPEHPRGTVHETKAIAEAAEQNYGY